MFIKDGKRFNPLATHTVDGFVYPGNILRFPAVVTKLGIAEVPEPAVPEDYSAELYYRTEQDTPPYVVYTRKGAEQIIAALIPSYEQALDNHLDAVAQVYRFANRHTLVARCGYPNTWQTLAMAFGTWMDNCNNIAYASLQDVIDQKRATPAVDTFLAELPAFSFVAD